MKKLLSLFMAFAIIGLLTGCKKDKTGDGGNNVETPKILSMEEVKDAAKNAGYITNDYIACSTSLTEDQMDGFTVEIYTSETTTNAYCVIVAISEDYAKQACEAVSNGHNSCIRNANVVTFPEVDASIDIQNMLKSITTGKPIKPIAPESK